MKTYIYEYPHWPELTWKYETLLTTLGRVRNMQGRILGKMESLGFKIKNEAVLETITQDVLKSGEIEGEKLDPSQIRSSLARKLGMHIPEMVRSGRKADAVVEMMLDATQKYDKPLTEERLFGWHELLFPEGRSGMNKIITGRYRDDSTGPMQVVSGAMGKEKVHYQAPEAKNLKKEMKRFIQWFNRKDNLDPVIKAGIAHFWFVTLHPFEDGNGRIARAIADMQLARADGSPQRFYSMSAQILKVRKQYYTILEKSQKGNTDITAWLQWFLNCLYDALDATEILQAKVMMKQEFWNRHAHTGLNSRQKLLLNKLMDGFEGKLNTSKWARIAKCSPDTALRDIQDLIRLKILKKESAGGRSTSYVLF